MSVPHFSPDRLLAAPRNGRHPTLADRYELGALLGSGTSASVYSAIDQHLQRAVTVKLFQPLGSEAPDWRTRFERQAARAARLRHPHIVAVLDAGFAELEPGRWTPYVVTEPAGPLSLRTVLDRAGRLPPAEVVRLGRQIAEALAYAHARGLVHANIKPENVLIDAQHHQAKLADFSLSFVSEATGLVSSKTLARRAAYLAPEQVRGETVGPPADIYALGVLLYELLVGRPPFVGSTPLATAERRVRERPRRAGEFEPSIPPALEAIVGRALERPPERRWRSAEQLANALEWADTSPPRPVRPRPRRRPPPRFTIGTLGRALRPALTAAPALLATVIAFVVALAMLDGLSNATARVGALFENRSAPELLGLPVKDARALTQAREAELIVVGERPSDRVPRGRIVQQTPVAGRLIPKREPIRVTLSSGVQVPDVRGLALPNAMETLARLGWRVGRVERSEQPGQSTDTVVLQHPPPGALVDEPGELLLAVAE